MAHITPDRDSIGQEHSGASAQPQWEGVHAEPDSRGPRSGQLGLKRSNQEVRLSSPEKGSAIPQAPAGTQIWRNAVEILGFRGVALPFTLLSSIITSRFLHPEGRGAYVIAVLSVSLAVTLVNNGAAIGHELGREAAEVRSTIVQGLILDWTLGLVASAAVFGISWGLSGEDPVILLPAALVVPAMLMWQTMSGALLALGRIRSWNIIQVLSPALLVAALIPLVVVLSLGVRGAIAAWASAQALLAASAMLVGRDLWWPTAGSSVSLARMWPIMFLGLRLGISNLVTFAMYRIDVFLLQVYVGLHAVGIYSLATTLAELVWYVPAALASSIVAPTVRASEARAAVIAAQAARHAIVATVLAGALLAAGATVGITAVYGQDFASARTPLLVLILSTVSIAPATSLAVYFSMKLGRSRYSLVGALVATSVTAVFALWLIPRQGALGAAIATTLGYSVSEVVEVVWFIRRSGLPASSLVPRRADLAVYQRLLGSVISRLRPSPGAK